VISTVRLQVSLTVSDATRREIARQRPDLTRTRRGALATRSAVVAYIQTRLDALSALSPWWDDEPLQPRELDDAHAAVEILRATGKPDAQIRAWLLLQRARYDLRRFQHGKPA
jgi:hypothetical protein